MLTLHWSHWHAGSSSVSLWCSFLTLQLLRDRDKRNIRDPVDKWNYTKHTVLKGMLHAHLFQIPFYSACTVVFFMNRCSATILENNSPKMSSAALIRLLVCFWPWQSEGMSLNLSYWPVTKTTNDVGRFYTQVEFFLNSWHSKQSSKAHRGVQGTSVARKMPTVHRKQQEKGASDCLIYPLKKFRSCFGCDLLCPTGNFQWTKQIFRHDCGFIWKNWEARTVLRGHG